jgi:hypothetical protein
MKYIIIIVISFSTLFAQNKEVNKLTGNLNTDSKIAFDNSVNQLQDKNLGAQHKSPFLAGAISFVLPGAGEIYTEHYIKAAIFLAVEAAGIVTSIIYNKKGNDQTQVFQDFANQHWDVERYAKWTIAHAQEINSNVDPSSYDVFNNSGNVNWNELNRLEGDLGGYYSHRLADYGEQQYYEMIGKYPQFNVGWDDFGDVNTPFHYGDPLTDNFIYYSDERGKANDFYNVASKAVVVLVINHILSAADAAWSAGRYNKSLEMKVDLQKTTIGYVTDIYPTFNIKVSF